MVYRCFIASIVFSLFVHPCFVLSHHQISFDFQLTTTMWLFGCSLLLLHASPFAFGCGRLLRPAGTCSFQILIFLWITSLGHSVIPLFKIKYWLCITDWLIDVCTIHMQLIDTVADRCSYVWTVGCIFLWFLCRWLRIILFGKSYIPRQAPPLLGLPNILVFFDIGIFF